jgi:hypothetical protein
MTGAPFNARSLLALAAWVVAISAHAQTPPPSAPPSPGMTDQQMMNAAGQVANGTPRNPGGFIPTPSDIAHGAANTAYSQQTQLTQNPNANNLNSATMQQATSTDAGAAAVGMGQSIVGNQATTSQYIDIAQNGKASNAIANQVQAENIGAPAPAAATGPPPDYYTTDQATGVTTPHWLPTPPPDNYAAVDAYAQQYIQNHEQGTRDPFAQQPPPTNTPNPTTNNEAPPVQMPGPLPVDNYPTYQPKPKPPASQDAQTANDNGAADAAQQVADAVAAAAEAATAAGQAASESAQAAQAAQAAEQQAQTTNSWDAGCASGACGSYQAHPYDPSQWQPAPVFTEGWNTVDGSASMTQVAQLLPIYQGYNPFATGALVATPGQMLFPTLYQPTGFTVAGMSFPIDPALGATGYTSLIGFWPSSVMVTPSLQAALCGR